MITFGSLFSGIGGIDLGLERAGMKCRWQVEIDEYCRGILARHWPLVPRLTDVRDVSASTVEAVDLICGGFPCQPVSVAGKRQGDGDHRWLWPQFARVVDELRPSLVLLENVPGLLSLGGAEVAADLASLGYDAEWHCFPAAAVGAYHKRDRWWCVAADANCTGVRQQSKHVGRCCSSSVIEHNGESRPSPHATSNGWQQRRAEPAGQQGRSYAAECGASAAHALCVNGGEIQDEARKSIIGSESGVARPEEHAAHAIRPRLEVGSCFGGDFAEELAAAFRSHRGEGGIWETFSTVGCLVDGAANRVAQLRALGNAVVPQVAEVIGKRIMEVM